MPVWELFSKRKKAAEKAGRVDVYAYDDVPRTLRVQIIHIWATAIGTCIEVSAYSDSPAANGLWASIHNLLAREYGTFSLSDRGTNAFERCQHFFLECDVDRALDVIEVSFQTIDRVVRRDTHAYRLYVENYQPPDEAIDELNARFREHAVGYEYQGGMLIRIDSQLLHAEVTKPALSLLHDKAFKGAADEFLSAHEHYRKGDMKEAINDALKSFESTLKTVCGLHGWKHDPRATAKPLLDIVIANGLIPDFLAGHFTGLRAALESGVPTVRNKTSGHGQGPLPQPVSRELAAHALHLCGANIVLLVGSSARLRAAK